MRKSLPRASVHEHHALRIYVGQVHRGTLHFRVSEAHLHVDVVDALEKVAEEAAGSFDGPVVPVGSDVYASKFHSQAD